MNRTGKNILINSLLIVVGLFLYAFGIYMIIQADIGAAPWDAFMLGLSAKLGIQYGTVSIGISLLLLAIDFFLLREPLGIETVLDALIVGKFVDLFDYLHIIPAQQGFVASLLLMLVGMILLGYAQFLCMRSSLGCGPRDALLVGLAKKLRKIPIGVVSILILVTVTVAAFFLDSPLGVGTLIYAVLVGPIMQLDFKTVHFDAASVTHQSITDSLRILLHH